MALVILASQDRSLVNSSTSLAAKNLTPGGRTAQRLEQTEGDKNGDIVRLATLAPMRFAPKHIVRAISNRDRADLTQQAPKVSKAGMILHQASQSIRSRAPLKMRGRVTIQAHCGRCQNELSLWQPESGQRTSEDLSLPDVQRYSLRRKVKRPPPMPASIRIVPSRGVYSTAFSTKFVMILNESKNRV